MAKGISEAVYLVMELVLIMIAIGFFLYFLSTIPSNEQSVRLNTELLRSKLHEACASGKSELTWLSYPQVKPQKLVIANALAAYRIRFLGDPDFLLYYEAFPIGEGIGWELYQNLGHRVFAPITFEGFTQGTRTYDDSIDKQLYIGDSSRYNKAFKLAIQKKPEIASDRIFVIVPNIMLSNYVNVIPTSEPSPFIPQIGKKDIKKGNAGEWIYNRPSNQEDVFRLNLRLSTEEKALVKYRPCGENSLCLKTPETVTRIPLGTTCGDIDYVHLNYVASDARSTLTAVGIGAAVTGTVIVTAGGIVYGPALATALSASTVGKVVLGSANVGKWIVSKSLSILSKIPLVNTIVTIAIAATGAKVAKEANDVVKEITGLIAVSFAGVKTSDFYIASPCTIQSKAEIQKIECSKLKGSGPGKCERWIKYPIYSIDVDAKNVKHVKFEGNHFQCVEGLGPADNSGAKPSDAPDGMCLQITISEPPQGYCWTKNAFREGWKSWFYNDISHLLQLTQIVDNTEFLDKNTIYINQIKDPLGVSTTFEILGFDWKWPG